MQMFESAPVGSLILGTVNAPSELYTESLHSYLVNHTRLRFRLPALPRGSQMAPPSGTHYSGKHSPHRRSQPVRQPIVCAHRRGSDEALRHLSVDPLRSFKRAAGRHDSQRHTADDSPGGSSTQGGGTRSFGGEP